MIKRMFGGKSRKRRGVLTFEWILLISLMVIGVIGGLAAVRIAPKEKNKKRRARTIAKTHTGPDRAASHAAYRDGIVCFQRGDYSCARAAWYACG